MSDMMEIFLVAPPGLEPILAEEARACGFTGAHAAPGGVTLQGGWPEVWRANLVLRGATRVLARIGSFRAFHLAQLDKRSRKFDWGAVLARGQRLRVETTCRASKIYHAKAASQRVERALTEELGAIITKDAALCLKVRIDDNLCTFSLDSTGESLHKRGNKAFVGKAPMRETLASLFLRAAGYDGREPVLDPMCGSGTFVIEAVEMAAGLLPGRNRSFAFEELPGFDSAAFEHMKSAEPAMAGKDGAADGPRFFGSDRDTGAVQGAQSNADRAGIAAQCRFTHAPVSALQRPDGPPGLVIANPPYGARIGNRKPLFAVHGALGQRLTEDFSGWRVGVITSDGGLAKATGLPFLPAGPVVPHGGLKIRLYQTAPLP